jgi:hypothetical protein
MINLARDEPSSLFCRSLRGEEKKSFVTLRSASSLLIFVPLFEIESAKISLSDKPRVVAKKL